jgi:hypothetical protein
MTTITALPTAPSRNMAPEVFNPTVDTFLGALPQMVTQTNTVAGEVNTNAQTASTAATTAVAAKNLASQASVDAQAAAGAALWAAANNYSTNTVVRSPTDYQLYIRLAPGGVQATDPAADTANTYWKRQQVTVSAQPSYVSADKTFALADSNIASIHPAADVTARTWTIPANSAVPFAVGTMLPIVNETGAGVLTIGITTDTMRLAGTAATGNRTLAANGVAVAIKIAATVWMITGTGVS